MTKEDLMSSWNGIVTDERFSLEMVQEHLGGLAGDGYLLDTFHAIASSGSSGPRGVFVYYWEGWLTYGLATFRNTVRWATTHPAAGPVVVAAVAAERANHTSSALLQTFSNRALPFHRVPVTLSLDEIVASLNEIRPTSLAGKPSMLHVLAEHARLANVASVPGALARPRS
jgi:phenylacetate-CoA ligase